MTTSEAIVWLELLRDGPILPGSSYTDAIDVVLMDIVRLKAEVERLKRERDWAWGEVEKVILHGLDDPSRQLDPAYDTDTALSLLCAAESRADHMERERVAAAAELEQLRAEVARLTRERDAALIEAGKQWKSGELELRTDAEWVAIGRRAAGLDDGRDEAQ